MKKPTISDVACRAGVSKSTVSAVMNNKSIVAEATKKRVEAAIRELSYRPSGPARQQFQAHLDRMIGFVIKESDNPYYADVLSGIEHVARAHGYRTFVSSSGGRYEEERAIIEQFTGLGFAGIIITPIMNDDADLSHIYELKRSNTPFVLLERVKGLQSNIVDVDNVQASCEAVKFLIDLGHSNILHLAGPSYSEHTEERIEGVRRAFSESHLRFDLGCIVPAGDSLDEGYQAMLRYLEAHPDPSVTAITCYNDLIALGASKALREAGLSIPGDVSIVGFDNLKLLDYTSLPLTTVHIPRHEMGCRAAELLIRQIESHTAAQTERVALKARLVIRESAGAYRREPHSRPVLVSA